MSLTRFSLVAYPSARRHEKAMTAPLHPSSNVFHATSSWAMEVAPRKFLDPTRRISMMSSIIGWWPGPQVELGQWQRLEFGILTRSMHKSALPPIFGGIINLQNPARNHFIIDVLDLRPSKDRLDPLKQTAIISIRGHKSSRISAKKQSQHATFVDKVVYCQVFRFLHTFRFQGRSL